jgi:hypothetical protein
MQTYYHYIDVPCTPLSSGPPSVHESIQIHDQTSSRSPAPAAATCNPKFLLGIFSIKEDIERRQIMRDSALSFIRTLMTETRLGFVP